MQQLIFIYHCCSNATATLYQLVLGKKNFYLVTFFQFWKHNDNDATCFCYFKKAFVFLRSNFVILYRFFFHRMMKIMMI